VQLGGFYSASDDIPQAMALIFISHTAQVSKGRAIQNTIISRKDHIGKNAIGIYCCKNHLSSFAHTFTDENDAPEIGNH